MTITVQVDQHAPEPKPRLRSEVFVPEHSKFGKITGETNETSTANEPPTVIESPKVTKSPANVEAPSTSSHAVTIETEEDSLVLMIDGSELNFESNEPCCSSSISQKAQPSEKINEIREFPTKIREDPVNSKRKESKESNFIIMRMEGKYPRFDDFKSTIIIFLKDFSWILFREFSDWSTVHIKFNNVKAAMKFKDVVSGMKHKNKCTVSYSFNTAKNVLGEAVEKKLKPLYSDETMYLVNDKLETLLCRHGQEWMQVTFDNPTYQDDI